MQQLGLKKRKNICICIYIQSISGIITAKWLPLGPANGAWRTHVKNPYTYQAIAYQMIITVVELKNNIISVRITCMSIACIHRVFNKTMCKT